MFDKFHLTFNFTSRVPHDVFKNKDACQSTPNICLFFKCYYHFGLSSSTRLFNYYHVNCVTRHSLCQILNCACQLTCISLCGSICVSNVRNLQILCKKYKHVDDLVSKLMMVTIEADVFIIFHVLVVIKKSSHCIMWWIGALYNYVMHPRVNHKVTKSGDQHKCFNAMKMILKSRKPRRLWD